MTYASPRTPGSTPLHDWDYFRMPSATPTPSPRPNWFHTSTPRRPATRAAHTRASSYSQGASGYAPWTHLESPRYNSQGDYCTVDVSAKDFPSSRRTSAHHQTSSRRDRRHSYTYVRASTPFGESDEDELIETLGRTFVLPAQSRFKSRHAAHAFMYDGGWYTNQSFHPQSSPYFADHVYARAASYDSPRQQQQPPPPPPHHRRQHRRYEEDEGEPSPPPPPQARTPTSHGHSHARRASASTPQRPSTARPTGSSQRPKAPPAPAKATEADARRHRIPAGYQLKNWDPSEEPILLLGSVFDANSLGKWIYDWTVFAQGASSPIAEMSGELWLLLIQLAGKLKRAEEVARLVRTADNRDILLDFIQAGDRLMAKLRSLLKSCEAPMLRAGSKKGSGLGTSSGVEFVNTLFGRERELTRTEKFMQNVRLFNLRFDANCEDIVQFPMA